jgi:hypothetical protein
MIDFLGPVLHPTALLGFAHPPLRSEPATTGMLRSSRVGDLSDYGSHVAVAAGPTEVILGWLR